MEIGRTELLGHVCLCRERGFGMVFLQELYRQVPLLPGKGGECKSRLARRMCVGWSLVVCSPMDGKQPVPTQLGAGSLHGDGSFWSGVVHLY